MFLSLTTLRNITTKHATNKMAMTRLMSTTNTNPHKPPMDLHGIHARYANATYMAASKSNLLDQVENELLGIQLTSTQSTNFANFLVNPMISRDDKTSTVQEMLGNGKVSNVTYNLMTTLAGNARLDMLHKIVDTYTKLMKAKRGEVEATIISADVLTKAQQSAVEAAMVSQVGKGKKVVLSTVVDPSILGGLQVQIGDQFLDLSVGSRIDTISRTAI